MFYVPRAQLVLKGIGCQVRCYGCTQPFQGVGLSFHAFNESRPPCGNNLATMTMVELMQIVHFLVYV